jgi:anti-sigma28 factor (negative regulator of flagellin synthesis)
MDIRPTNISGITRVYQKNMNSSIPKSSQTTNVSKQDVVEISKEALDRSEFGGVIRSTAAEVARDVPAETIKKLREAIENGTYPVSGEMIARAILARISR